MQRKMLYLYASSEWFRGSKCPARVSEVWRSRGDIQLLAREMTLRALEKNEESVGLVALHILEIDLKLSLPHRR